MVRYIVLIRHGSHEGDHISKDAFQQMRARARDIVELAGGGIKVLSSTAPWAQASAKVLTDCLNLPGAEACSLLWSDREHVEDFPGLIRLIEEQDTNILVLVTHVEYAEQFPNFYAMSKRGRGFPILDIRRGEGVIIIPAGFVFQRLLN